MAKLPERAVKPRESRMTTEASTVSVQMKIVNGKKCKVTRLRAISDKNVAINKAVWGGGPKIKGKHFHGKGMPFD